MSLSANLNFQFHDGALCLNAAGVEMRLIWDPKPLAEMRLTGGQWQPFYPEFRILAPSVSPLAGEAPDNGRLQAKYAAFHSFRSGLPEDMAKAVEPFTSYQWPLLTLLQASTAGLDLVHANPVLAYALANNDQIRATPTHATAMNAARYSHRKQRDILGWLDFPDTDAMARILKKVPLAIVYPGLMRKLRQCVRSPGILEKFGHLPALNTGTIFLASHADMAALITPKLIQEVAGAEDEVMETPTADLLSEIVTAASEMLKKSTLKPFTSRLKVQECYDRLIPEYQNFKGIIHRQEEIKVAQRKLTERYRICGIPTYIQDQIDALQAEYKRIDALRPDRMPLPRPPPRLSTHPFIDWSRLRALTFPPPPIPGNENIVPLTSFPAFEEEGASQSICLGRNLTYVDRVMRGETYVYKVLGPERHTLSIVKRGSNNWQIGDFKRFKNATFTESTETVVKNWLNANQVSL